MLKRLPQLTLFSQVRRCTAYILALGNGKSTGSKLVSLDGSFNKPGIYEVAMGMPLAELFTMAGGFSKPLKALHIGGPLGGVVPISAVEKLTLILNHLRKMVFCWGMPV